MSGYGVRAPHPLAGKTVVLKAANGATELDGRKFRIEDYWQNVSGKSWMDSSVIAAINYAVRGSTSGLPEDDEVVYGHIGSLGYLVHQSELGGVVDV